MQRYSDCPQILREFLIYHENIKGQSPLTISEYYLDLRMFLRFLKLMRNDMPITTKLEDIVIKDIDLGFLREIETSDIFDFLSYLANDRTVNPDSPSPDYGISPTARARKLSAIKSFYKYLTVRTKQLEENPWDVFETIFTVGSIHEGTITELLDKGAVIALPHGVEGFATPKHLTKEDGSSANQGETLQFKVIEFNKDAKRIILSHSRIFEDEAKAESKKAAKKAAKTEDAPVAPAIEKTTLGDLEELAALKEKLSKK